MKRRATARRIQPHDRTQKPLGRPEVHVHPGAGAVVMGSGIVSIALLLDREKLLSRIWLAFAATAWVLLALLVVAELARDRRRLTSDLRTPASLTGVAATAVLGARLESLGSGGAATALLAVAAAMWAGLTFGALRGQRLPRSGSSFMPTVSLESLAALAALHSNVDRVAWMTYPAVALCVLGLVLYPWALVRFDLRELLVGSGDHWIAGGALAISALAISEISVAASRQAGLRALAPAVADIGVAVWIAGALWLPLLVAGELSARRIGHGLRRWSTLFPVGMYAASGFDVGHVSRFGAAASFARVWTWVGVALSLALVVGLIRGASTMTRAASSGP